MKLGRSCIGLLLSVMLLLGASAGCSRALRDGVSIGVTDGVSDGVAEVIAWFLTQSVDQGE